MLGTFSGICPGGMRLKIECLDIYVGVHITIGVSKNCDLYASEIGIQSLNLVRDELDDEWQELQVRLRLLRREEDDDGQAVEEDQEPDQVRPDVDRLVVEPEPAAKVFQA